MHDNQDSNIKNSITIVFKIIFLKSNNYSCFYISPRVAKFAIVGIGKITTALKKSDQTLIFFFFKRKKIDLYEKKAIKKTNKKQNDL